VLLVCDAGVERHELEELPRLLERRDAVSNRWLQVLAAADTGLIERSKIIEIYEELPRSGRSLPGLSHNARCSPRSTFGGRTDLDKSRMKVTYSALDGGTRRDT